MLETSADGLGISGFAFDDGILVDELYALNHET